MVNNIYSFLWAIFIAIFIVLIGVSVEPSFFFIDDAQNEFLPFSREIGRIWLNGEFPFILKNTFFGSNTLIDIHRAIFLPQNILLSILSVKIHSLTLIANISAFINIAIIIFSSIKLSEALDIKKEVGIIVASLFAISPIFLYFYLESWWNGAIGQAWFVAGFASILFLRKNFTSFNLFMNAVTTYSILASGWPHSAVAYAILATLFCMELLWDKKYKELIVFSFFSIAIICIVIPLYSEYLTSSDLIGRASHVNNEGNFLSTTLNQIIFTFSPVYYHFMNKFQGYTLTHIPVGYSSIYILFALCFVDLKKAFQNRNVIFISILVLLFFILNQTPTHLGPLRWTFRFTPYFTESLILLGVIILNNKIIFSRVRVGLFIGIIFLSSLLSLFSQEDNFGFMLLIQLAFIVITLVYLWMFTYTLKITLAPSLIYTFSMLGLMLAVKSSILGYVAMPLLKNDISFDNNYSKGYLLSLTNGRQPKDHIEDLNGAQFLLFNLKAINGASPVGNNLISNVLSVYSSQAYFNVESTIENLSQKYNEVCKFNLFNIDTIVLNREDLTDNVKTDITSCGFINKPVYNQNVRFYIYPSYKDKGSISYFSQGITNLSVLDDKYETEKYKISSNNESEIIFSRVFWHGYNVTLNGKKLEVYPQDGVIKVKIPAHISNGILVLDYFPRSWQYSLWISLLGFLLAILAIWSVRKWDN